MNFILHVDKVYLYLFVSKCKMVCYTLKCYVLSLGVTTPFRMIRTKLSK